MNVNSVRNRKIKMVIKHIVISSKNDDIENIKFKQKTVKGYQSFENGCTMDRDQMAGNC